MPALNPLFIALVIAGAVLVVGVILINWLQERRVRGRIGAAFQKSGGPGLGADRVEPMFGASDGEASATVAEGASASADDETLAALEEGDGFAGVPRMEAREETSQNAPDPDIECVVVLQPQQPTPTAALKPALDAGHGKPVRWLGRRAPGLPWQSLDAAASGPWQELCACLLLANRAGAATREDVEAFLRSVSQVAQRLRAPVDSQDAAGEAARAEALDRFCADLDVQIGLTVLKGDGGQILGTRLRGVAEAAGFRLTPAGQFDFVQDETGATLYSLQNYRNEPFTAESLRALSTPGVVFLLDVPRVADPVRVFDQMRLAAKRMTQTLEGVLVDDNRRPLTDAALSAIRGQVQATAAAMRAAHIDPGSPRAMRLFG